MSSCASFGGRCSASAAPTRCVNTSRHPTAKPLCRLPCERPFIGRPTVSTSGCPCGCVACVAVVCVESVLLLVSVFARILCQCVGMEGATICVASVLSVCCLCVACVLPIFLPICCLCVVSVLIHSTSPSADVMEAMLPFSDSARVASFETRGYGPCRGVSVLVCQRWVGVWGIDCLVAYACT